MENVGTLISVSAALLAALSALYAKKQAGAAERFHKIALHSHRLRVYNGLVHYRAHIGASGIGFKEDEVLKFAEVAELSQCYFPVEIASRLNAVVENSLKLLSLNAQWEDDRPDSLERLTALAENRQTLMQSIHDESGKVVNELKRYLRANSRLK